MLGTGAFNPENDVGEGLAENHPRGLVAVAGFDLLHRLEAQNDRVIVAATLRLYADSDDDAVNSLVDACRRERADATGEEIAHFVREKGKLITRKIANPVGFLLTAVPRCFASDSFRQYREQRTRERSQQAVKEEAPGAMETRIEHLKEILADEVLGEYHPARLAWAKELAELEVRLAAKDCEHQAAGSEHDAKAREAGGF